MFRYLLVIEGLDSKEDTLAIKKLLNNELTSIANINAKKKEVTIDTDDSIENINSILEEAGYGIVELELL